MMIWWVELSYPFEDLRGTHAATCDPVALVYLVIKTVWKFLCLLKGFLSTQTSNLRAKIIFANMLKNYLICRKFLTYLQNWFWLSNLISECLHTLLISTKFLLEDKNWQRLQYHRFILLPNYGWYHYLRLSSLSLSLCLNVKKLVSHISDEGLVYSLTSNKWT